MPINLASPGILVREVDLTIGRVDTATDKTAAIVAAFSKGPVNIPTTVENEADLIDLFGEPTATDSQYEDWMVASSYLSYGGVLSVVRADDDDLKNAFAGVTTSSIKIRSVEDYTNNGYDENTITDVVVAARNPGSWGNDVKVCIIDNVADQILTVGTGHSAEVGYGISMDVPSATYQIGAGSTSVLDGFYKGIVTEKDDTQISVKFISHVSAAGTETAKDYEPLGTFSFPGTGTLSYINVGTGTAIGTESVTAQKDWYDQQTVQLTNSTLQWSQLADRPGTSNFAAARSSRFDELHVVVIDDKLSLIHI